MQRMFLILISWAVSATHSMCEAPRKMERSDFEKWSVYKFEESELLMGEAPIVELFEGKQRLSCSETDLALIFINGSYELFLAINTSEYFCNSSSEQWETSSGKLLPVNYSALCYLNLSEEWFLLEECNTTLKIGNETASGMILGYTCPIGYHAVLNTAVDGDMEDFHGHNYICYGSSKLLDFGNILKTKSQFSTECVEDPSTACSMEKATKESYLAAGFNLSSRIDFNIVDYVLYNKYNHTIASCENNGMNFFVIDGPNVLYAMEELACNEETGRWEDVRTGFSFGKSVQLACQLGHAEGCFSLMFVFNAKPISPAYENEDEPVFTGIYIREFSKCAEGTQLYALDYFGGDLSRTTPIRSLQCDQQFGDQRKVDGEVLEDPDTYPYWLTCKESELGDCENGHQNGDIWIDDRFEKKCTATETGHCVTIEGCLSAYNQTKIDKGQNLTVTDDNGCKHTSYCIEEGTTTRVHDEGPICE